MTLTLNQSSEHLGTGHWRWSVWLEGASQELRNVREVEYVLDSSFIPPIRVVKNRRTRFRLDAFARGEFSLTAVVSLANGETRQLQHQIKLEQPTEDKSRSSKSRHRARVKEAEAELAGISVDETKSLDSGLARRNQFLYPLETERLTEGDSPQPHVTFIHGIANKPASEVLLKFWLESLIADHGIDLLADGVSASMVYWADVLYPEALLESMSAEEAALADSASLAKASAWEAALVPQERFFVESLRKKLESTSADAFPKLSELEGAISAEERVPLPWFIKRPVMERLLRDVHHYLFNVEFSPKPEVTYRVQDEIRRRFTAALQRATGRPHVVVSHSVGTVIAYDCLRRVPDCPAVDALMTIGSPLGLDEIQDMLRPEWSRDNGFPADKVGHWTNVFDRLDPVCGFDPKLANDFKRDHEEIIQDIHEPNSGWWRHSIDKYLSGPLLRDALKRAVKPTVGPSVAMQLEMRPQRGRSATVFAGNFPPPIGESSEPHAIKSVGEMKADPPAFAEPVSPSASATGFLSHGPSIETTSRDIAFLNDLRQALDSFNHRRAAELCKEYAASVSRTQIPPNKARAAEILKNLRRKRHFGEVRQVADALIGAGQNAPRVRSTYVQSLIDEGDITAGLDMALALAADSSASDESDEAQGLIGRAYKQRYIQTGRPEWLNKAVEAYYGVYNKLDKDYFWHGINTVALLARAERDQIRFYGLPYYPDLAKSILAAIHQLEERGQAATWDRATALEACVALRRTQDALLWARNYVHSPEVDAFELASTIRQLTEVWQLNKLQEPGSLLLPLLEAELLKRQGGEVVLDLRNPVSAYATQLDEAGQLEKVFGRDSYRTWIWYREGLERCGGVARLETETGQGVGTGFVVDGGQFGGRSGEQLLLTNSHVLSNDSIDGALTQSQAIVRFESLDSRVHRCRVKQIIASSRPDQLDFTLARLETTVSHAKGFPLSPEPPKAGTLQRLYAIGHPLGGVLSFSLHDNLLVDFRSPFVHYRTPTDPGSSGCPIFDDQWKLVALHHSGSKTMRRLHKEGVYEANEGIWIGAIRDRLGGAQKASIAPSSSAGPALHVRHSWSSRETPASRVEGASMSTQDKESRLRQFMAEVAAPDRLEHIKREAPLRAELAVELAMESAAPLAMPMSPEAAERAVEKVQTGQPLNSDEMFAMEAIILPRERPVVFVENDTFTTPESPWEHFVEPGIKARIDRAIPSIGRVELPNNLSIPFGGTAFVVGPGLLMTNRHVAELFASGLGHNVMFRSGQTAGWDYRRERSSTDGGTMLNVRNILMIHPFWDMALLQVEGLLASQRPLTLSVRSPEDLGEREIAVIGYPAKDWRNDSDLQDRIFGRVYNVKRLQPGKIKSREEITSFNNRVRAMTHDSSTLGGNSGSAILDVQTGEIVGLHFAGLYLKANYAVPTYELARDPRVVQAAVNFNGFVPADSQLDVIWRRTGVESGQPIAPAMVGAGTGLHATSLNIEIGGTRLSIPVSLSLSSVGTISGGGRTESAVAAEFLEAMRNPIVFPRLTTRGGYNSKFLELDSGDDVPLPKLTKAGEEIVARVDGGSAELAYHKFSIVMHKKRRLSLFTAANVDWRDHMRKINGRKPTRKELTGLGPNDQEKWFTDDRIPENQQLPDKFFTKDGTAFDKGHLVRRDDVCWGKTFTDIQKANGDTYHTTNCSPQVAGFNQSARGEDNWGDLENLVQSETGAEKCILFSGPVLDDEDLSFDGVDERGEVSIQIPSQFWKIVVVSGENGPQAFGFVLEQDLSDVPLEFAVPRAWRRYMKPIAEIEELLFGLAELDWLKQHDQFVSKRGERLRTRSKR